MKSLKYIIILLLSVSIAMANSKEKDQVELKVNGIGCPYCSIGFVKKIQKLGSISDIDTEYETGIFTFKIASDKKVSFDDLSKVVIDAGYTLVYAKIHRSTNEVETFGELQ